MEASAIDIGKVRYGIVMPFIIERRCLMRWRRLVGIMTRRLIINHGGIHARRWR